MNKHPRNRVLRRGALRLVPAILAYVALSAARPAPAQEGIVVHGTGAASARPTQIELSAKLTAEAELAADAVVKYRDAKRRALAAITALMNPDLSVISGGVSVATGMDSYQQQMMAMRGMAVASTNAKVRIIESSRIVLDHADKLEPDELLEKVLKILDVAKDASFELGPPPTNDYYEMQLRAQVGQVVVSFKLPDSTDLRKKAYKAAFADAKAKAQELAELSGTKLGRILSVQEGPGANAQTNVVYYNSNMNRGGADTTLASAASGEVTFHVTLTVQFEIAK